MTVVVVLTVVVRTDVVLSVANAVVRVVMVADETTVTVDGFATAVTETVEVVVAVTVVVAVADTVLTDVTVLVAVAGSVVVCAVNPKHEQADE